MNKVFREHMLILSAIVFGIGIVMTAIGFMWYFTFVQSNIVDSSIQEFSKKLGDWGWWILIPSPFILIIGGWYFFDQILARKKFNELVNTNSKAGLVRNTGEIEDIIWKLPEKYGLKFVEKKKKFRIK